MNVQSAATIDPPATMAPPPVAMPANDLAPIVGAALSAVLPQRFPFMMLDQITAWETGAWARGVKCVAAHEPLLTDPGARFWPEPYVIESLGQLAIALFNLDAGDGAAPTVLLGSVAGVTYHKRIPLGARLDLEVRIERFFGDSFVCSGRCDIDGVQHLEMEALTCKILNHGTTS